MWNIKEIESHQKTLIEKYAESTDVHQKASLAFVLYQYFIMLENCGTLRYTGFYNLLSKGKLEVHTSRQMRYEALVDRSYQSYTFLRNPSYLSFVVELLENLAEIDEVEDPVFQPINMNEDYLYAFSEDFYRSLDDEEITPIAFALLEDRTNYQISSRILKGMENYGGITFHDPFFNKYYALISKDHSIFDLQSLNHETMHMVDGVMNPCFKHLFNQAFPEVPTYTIDYLTYDYLESQGFIESEVSKLRTNSYLYAKTLSIITLQKVKNWQRDSKDNDPLPIALERNLLEVVSIVLSYGLYEEIKKDKDLGFQKLKDFMKTDFAYDEKPDFSFIGISDENLITYSKTLGRNDSFTK